MDGEYKAYIVVTKRNYDDNADYIVAEYCTQEFPVLIKLSDLIQEHHIAKVTTTKE